MNGLIILLCLRKNRSSDSTAIFSVCFTAVHLLQLAAISRFSGTITFQLRVIIRFLIELTVMLHNLNAVIFQSLTIWFKMQCFNFSPPKSPAV